MKYVILWALMSTLLFLVLGLTVAALEHFGKFYEAHKLKPFVVYSVINLGAAACTTVGLTLVHVWSVL